MSNDFSAVIKHHLENSIMSAEAREEGKVLSVDDSVCTIYGFKEISLGEVVTFQNGMLGICFDLDTSIIGVIILGDSSKILSGFSVVRTYKQFEIPVGKELLGRVINGFGKPIDDKGDITGSYSIKIENNTPNLKDIDTVNDCFYTGIKVIDSLIPIGKGYSELIIGNKQTGKTSIIIDTILNQNTLNNKVATNENKIFCIYVSIGQQISHVAQFVKKLEENGAMEYSCVVAATASDKASAQYLAPFVGCTIAEYFRNNGMNAVVFYDTLSSHAIAYRQLSLLLKKFPSIQSYPVDMFYIHARLLERSSQLSQENGGGSLTSIAVTDTLSNDLSSFIVENLISVTDAQIFLDAKLLHQGIRPAVNFNHPINAISSKLQINIIKKILSGIKSDLKKYNDIKATFQSSMNLDESMNKIIRRGLIWSEIFKQETNKPVPIELQVISLIAVYKGFYDKLPVELIKSCEKELLLEANLLLTAILSKIRLNSDLTYDEEEKVTNFLNNFIEGFISINVLITK